MSEAANSIQVFALAHRLPAAVIERWLALDEGDGRALLELAQKLRMRTGQIATALELLSEIAIRERCSIASLLERPELRDAISRGGSRPARASALLGKLREIRYPRLHEARARLQEAVAQLGLPAGITVLLPRELSSDELQIRVAATSPAQLKRQLAALCQSSDGLEGIVAALGGKPGIN